jgi:hypothetical protein
MPIFHLKPRSRHLDDAAWSSCAFRSECWVNADDEAEARGLAGASATGMFAQPSPWRDRALVEATIVQDCPAGMVIAKNTVLAPS